MAGNGMGTSLERHGMCELALKGTLYLPFLGHLRLK
jgi:hypothetical protein